MIRGRFPAARGPLDLYNFIDDGVRRAFFEQGALPWWASQNIKLKFFRPISSLIVWFDHTSLQRPLLMHLHSLGWWVAASLAARQLLRRLFSERVATMALIIFALAPCHALPLAWLANREALIALTFGTVGFTAYVTFRRDASARGSLEFVRPALVSTAFFTVAMFSGEYALCIGGYVVAFEVFRRGDSFLRRLVGLLPFAAPAVTYLVLRRVWDYGAIGSGFYTDPFVDPRAYFSGAPWRFVALVGDAWLSPDVDGYRPRWVALPVLAVVAALVVGPLRRAIRALEGEERRASHFMLAGSFLSLLPVVSVIPSMRLLGAAMLGVSSSVAIVLDYAWFGEGVTGIRRERARLSERLTGTVALLLGFAHLVRGPVLASITAGAVRARAISFLEHADFLRDHLTDPAEQRLIVVRATDEVFFLPFILMAKGVAPPKLIALTDASHVLLLSKDAHTIHGIVPPDKTLVHEGEGSLFRDQAAILKKGSWVSVNGMRATVLESGERGPTQARFAFDQEYDSKNLVWVTTGTKEVRTIDPPRPGFGLPVDP